MHKIKDNVKDNKYKINSIILNVKANITFIFMRKVNVTGI